MKYCMFSESANMSAAQMKPYTEAKHSELLDLGTVLNICFKKLSAMGFGQSGNTESDHSNGGNTVYITEAVNTLKEENLFLNKPGRRHSKFTNFQHSLACSDVSVLKQRIFKYRDKMADELPLVENSSSDADVMET